MKALPYIIAFYLCALPTGFALHNILDSQHGGNVQQHSSSLRSDVLDSPSGGLGNTFDASASAIVSDAIPEKRAGSNPAESTYDAKSILTAFGQPDPKEMDVKDMSLPSYYGEDSAYYLDGASQPSGPQWVYPITPITPTPQSVPEPSCEILLIVGLIYLAAKVKRP